MSTKWMNHISPEVFARSCLACMLWHWPFLLEYDNLSVHYPSVFCLWWHALGPDNAKQSLYSSAGTIIATQPSRLRICFDIWPLMTLKLILGLIHMGCLPSNRWASCYFFLVLTLATNTFGPDPLPIQHSIRIARSVSEMCH